MKKYELRYFCRHIECGCQEILDDVEIEASVKAYSKENYCFRCKAYEFHQYLKTEGYEIVKETNNCKDGDDLKMLDKIKEDLENEIKYIELERIKSLTEHNVKISQLQMQRDYLEKLISVIDKNKKVKTYSCVKCKHYWPNADDCNKGRLQSTEDVLTECDDFKIK